MLLNKTYQTQIVIQNRILFMCFLTCLLTTHKYDVSKLYSDIHNRQLIAGGIFVMLGCSEFFFDSPLYVTTNPRVGMVIAKRVIMKESYLISMHGFLSKSLINLAHFI